VEAIAHLTKGLELLAALPDTKEHRQQELAVQMTLAPALMVTKGFTALDLERVYTRACALCWAEGDTRQLCTVLWRLRALAWPNASKTQRGSWWLPLETAVLVEREGVRTWVDRTITRRLDPEMADPAYIRW
jgi:hypothetical protein